MKTFTFQQFLFQNVLFPKSVVRLGDEKTFFFLKKKNLWNESLAAINSNELSLKMFKDRFTIS